jgi:hypothetical protein
MKNLRMILLAAVVGLGAGGAMAQPGSGKGPGTGPGPMGAGPAARAPAMGAGMGPGMRHGNGAGMGPHGGHGAARPGANNAPGWRLMNPQERTEHRDRMRAMKSYDECKTYQDQHHEQMAARAKERGGKALPQPRRDPCAGLKK